MSNVEEKRLLKDIDALKKAIPDMKRLSELEPELVKLREQRKAIQADLDVVKKLIDEKDAEINSVKKQSEAQRNKKSEVRDAAEKFTAEIDKENEELTQIYKTKDRSREDYYKALYEFEVQNERIRYIKGLLNQKKKLTADLEEKKKRIEQKKVEIAARANPNTKEIEICEELIKYCQRRKAEAGLVPPTSEQVALQAQNDYIAEQNRQELEQKLKDGKIQAAASKKDDMMVVGGGGKGKKGKKPKNQQKTETNQSETFSIDFYQIKKFGAVLLSPPTAPEDLDPTIEELKKKQKAYIEAGDAELKKETSDLEKRIEYEVE